MGAAVAAAVTLAVLLEERRGLELLSSRVSAP
jgi:hypothetical protein